MLIWSTLKNSGRFFEKLVIGVIFSGFSIQANAINLVQLENTAYPPVAEDYQWNAFYPPRNMHDIEGYADKASVHLGESIKFFVNTNSTIDPTYSLTIYRLGWYQGVGARRMTTPVVRSSVIQTLPTPDPVTGLIEANWIDPYEVKVPWSWVSGVYVAALVGEKSGRGQYIPFVVKRNDSRAPYLFQTSDTTWQAYNNWGGKSLYTYNSTDKVPARKVSYNRPYADGYGTGALSLWELKMLRFLEREGYDVTYQSNIDTHTGGMWQLTKHKAFLSVGHDEYWTKLMRNNVENAKWLKGLSLGFFGANAAYWQARLEDSTVTGQRYRTLVSYKDYAQTEDPYALDKDISNDTEITTTWRDTRYFNRPENGLIGVMYTFDPVNSDIVITNADHWVYTGTGLKNGDKLTGLLGYEVDSYVDNGKSPLGLTILAHSPFGTAGGYSDMAIHTQSCLSLLCANRTSVVFATGSMQWNWGLDSIYQSKNLENEAVKQVTRNVLAGMIGAPLLQ